MIALDANGADGGPRVVAEGARRYGGPVLLFGPASELGTAADVIDSPDWVSNHESPLEALHARPQASIARAAGAVADGRAQALVTAGSTGAALAASLAHFGLATGVRRAALAVLLPGHARPTLLLDAGAGSRARAEHLVELAHLGAAFMHAVEGVGRPSVALLSVGAEPEKGPPEVVEAGRLLREGALAYYGNVEGGDLLTGVVDVVVADGFTGNVALKAMEGAARTVARAVRGGLRSAPRATLGGLLARPALRDVAARFDADAHGGAILLGLARPVVVAHGASSPGAIAAALALACRAVDARVVERTCAALVDMGSGAAGSFERRLAREPRIRS